ncbi:hypothetical protein [Haladaptatus sp. DYF46]|uniref:hypothetical protein n=1 Tax=Haladaptatus sp. DYF46 TaxID=2886041 RepID=UPI001E52EC18|nr:hypothetical protein [Haladaptatus sp. DYF46]
MVISLGNVYIFNILFEGDRIISYGFSGVVAGYIGFLFIIIIIFYQKRYGPWIAFWLAQLAIIMGTGRLLIRHINAISVKYFTSALVVSILASSVKVSPNIFQLKNSQFSWEQWYVSALFVFLSMGLIVSLFMMLFLPIRDISSTTNVYAHGVGFISGTIISAIVFTKGQ